MADGSVFQRLARMYLERDATMNPDRGDNSDLDQMSKECSPRYEPPSDNIGNEIIMEFARRGQELTEVERLLALKYFCDDYKKALECAVMHFETAKKTVPSSETHETSLRLAWNLTRRATVDAQRARKFYSGVDAVRLGLSGEADFEALQGFQNQLSFLTESPNAYRKMHSLFSPIDPGPQADYMNMLRN